MSSLKKDSKVPLLQGLPRSCSITGREPEVVQPPPIPRDEMSKRAADAADGTLLHHPWWEMMRP